VVSAPVISTYVASSLNYSGSPAMRSPCCNFLRSSGRRYSWRPEKILAYAQTLIKPPAMT
jgi:hypothetical protein